MLLLQELKSDLVLNETKIFVSDRPVAIGRGQNAERGGYAIGADFPQEIKRLISRVQATLELSPLGLLIRDGNGQPSQSGILVNGETVDSEFLSVGDEVTLFAIADYQILLTYQEEIAVDRYREPRTGEYFNAIKVFDERLQHVEGWLEHMESQVIEIKKNVEAHRETFKDAIAAIAKIEQNVVEKAAVDEQQSAAVTAIAKQVKSMILTLCVAASLWGFVGIASGIAAKEQELYRKRAIDIAFLVLEKPELWTMIFGGGAALIVKRSAK